MLQIQLSTGFWQSSMLWKEYERKIPMRTYSFGDPCVVASMGTLRFG